MQLNDWMTEKVRTYADGVSRVIILVEWELTGKQSGRVEHTCVRWEECARQAGFNVPYYSQHRQSSTSLEGMLTNHQNHGWLD